MTQVDELVAVWLKDGRPNRLVWGSRRYRVTDAPTRLGAEMPDSFLDAGAFTHPPRIALGWRFQATSDDGESRIFDIRHDDHRDVWRLVRTFD